MTVRAWCPCCGQLTECESRHGGSNVEILVCLRDGCHHTWTEFLQ